MYGGFWSHNTLSWIIVETNIYDNERLANGCKSVEGRIGFTRYPWVENIHGYISKKLPNVPLYHASCEPVFWSPVIFNFMNKDRQLGIWRCLHLIQSKLVRIDCESTSYDKMYIIHWLLDDFRDMYVVPFDIVIHLSLWRMGIARTLGWQRMYHEDNKNC